MNRISVLSVPIFLALAAVLAACDEDTITRPPPGSGGPSTVEVLATADLTFEETPVQIEVGDTVRWRNDSDFVHTVTPVGHEAWEAAQAGSRGAVILEHTFTEPGTYHFRCENHSPPDFQSGDMTGTIHVIGS